MDFQASHQNGFAGAGYGERGVGLQASDPDSPLCRVQCVVSGDLSLGIIVDFGRASYAWNNATAAPTNDLATELSFLPSSSKMSIRYYFPIPIQSLPRSGATGFFYRAEKKSSCVLLSNSQA